MWDDIKPFDVEGYNRAIRERDEYAHRTETAAQKLLEMGVSREQLVKDGILKPPGQ